MGSFSLWHWIVVLLIVLVLFGRGRVSEIMGDFGKGIKSFKSGMNDETSGKADTATPPPAQITLPEAAPTPTASDTTNSTNGQ
jgi:sec-independent protein translocase protein TatA